MDKALELLDRAESVARRLMVRLGALGERIKVEDDLDIHHAVRLRLLSARTRRVGERVTVKMHVPEEGGAIFLSLSRERHVEFDFGLGTAEFYSYLRSDDELAESYERQFEESLAELDSSAAGLDWQRGGFVAKMSSAAPNADPEKENG